MYCRCRRVMPLMCVSRGCDFRRLWRPQPCVDVKMQTPKCFNFLWRIQQRQHTTPTQVEIAKLQKAAARTCWGGGSCRVAASGTGTVADFSAAMASPSDSPSSHYVPLRLGTRAPSAWAMSPRKRWIRAWPSCKASRTDGCMATAQHCAADMYQCATGKARAFDTSHEVR